MRVRMGFVSNSSSSSFVVIDKSGKHDIPYWLSEEDELIVDGNLGMTEFGWGPYTCRNVGDRINFAYVQILEALNPYRNLKDVANNWLEMLDDVLKESFGVSTVIYKIHNDETNFDGNDFGYIDHQSSVAEGENIEIFDDKETLKNFLFGKNSYIVLDNDNH